MKKEELIAALAAYVPALAKLARLAGITVTRKSSTAKRAAPAKKAATATEAEPARAARTERPRSAAAKKSTAAAKEKSSGGRAAASKPASKVKEVRQKVAAKVKEALEPRTASTVKAAPKVKAAPEPRPPRDTTAKAKPVEQLGEGRVSAPKRVAAKRASEKPGATPPARPAQVVTFLPKARASREPAASNTPVPEPTAGAITGVADAFASTPAPEAPAAPPVEQHAAEPLVEGFFVARVAGEDEARRHHMVGESQRPPSSNHLAEYDEGLGELPAGYQDDGALLLPKDPHTLFVSWDFSSAAKSRAMRGLESPRAVLRVFDGEKLAREQDCMLEMHGFYIHGLQPGRPYRVEVHFVGRDGRSRRIGQSSNRVALPPIGTSTDHTVRFLRVPTPRAPEPQFLPERVPPVRANAPEAEEREYITWRRVSLPGSAGAQDIPESRRERSGPGPGAPAASHMEAVPRPAGASDQRYVESRERAPGASDMRYLESTERAPGASEQRYLEAPRERPYLDVGRAPGASDLRYLESPGRAPGASDMRYQEAWPGRASAPYQYLDIGRAPGGASDLRYGASPGRAPGASDSASRPQGSSEEPLPRKPPSGGGHS
ncbi:DUF4912 domain-containing protein [Myxococcus sp. RHST-1-4]|nr:DUF4912 domain-containing protein [Myxococcus sp. RHSTA-1-4]